MKILNLLKLEIPEILENILKEELFTKLKNQRLLSENYRKRSEIMWDSNCKLYCCDFTKSGRQLLLFWTFGQLQEYYSSHDYKLPELNNIKQVNEIVEQVKKYQEVKNKKDDCFKNIIEFDEKLVLNTIRWPSAHLCPKTAFFG